MKKCISLILALLVILALSTACSSADTPSETAGTTGPASTEPGIESTDKPGITYPDGYFSMEPDANIRVASLKGPTSMGLLNLMEANENGESVSNYDFNIVGTADEIVAMLNSGQIDLAAVPANLASTLYNKTGGEIMVCAINTLGVLYILDTTGTVNSIDDLAGKTVYSTGKGTTPEYVLNHILTENDIDPENDLTIEYKAEAAELSALMAAGEIEIALLPEPLATSVLMQNSDARVALSLTDEWNIVEPNSDLVTGVLIVTISFLNENPRRMSAFLTEYKASVESANANIEETAELVVKYGLVGKAEIAVQAIPRCNLVFFESSDIQNMLEGYLNVLYIANPASIGGAMPDEGFYYVYK